VAKIWKLPIDAADHFDVIVLDVLQVLLLQEFGVFNHLLVKVVVGLQSDELKPVLEVVMINFFITEEADESQQQLKQG
jgi:hypothetical protein